MPVFNKKKLVGFVACSAHQIDMGGAAPGSQKVQGVTEAYQEGLRLLPVRFVKKGDIDEDILRVILGNVRVPEKVRGDLLAQHTANLSAAARLSKLIDDYGLKIVKRAYEFILDRSEQAMRKALSLVPKGKYSFDDYLDDYGPGTMPVKMAVDITFDGLGGVEIDFSRSSDAVPAAINSYINYTRAYALFAIKVFCDAKDPQTEGAMRPITIKAREGSFFNPSFPAPSGGRAILQIRIFDTINGALSQALPKKAMGAFSHWSNPNIGGIDDRTKKQFVMYDLSLAGYGGRYGEDGPEALSPVMNCTNIPIEVHESLNPIRINCLELLQDSGGAGQWRGGCGLRKDMELLNSKAVLSHLADRHKFPPYGVFHGKAGRLAETLLIRGNKKKVLPSKGVEDLQEGDILSFRLSGAGGYGPPNRRDQDAIKRDIENGYISVEAAKRDYNWS